MTHMHKLERIQFYLHMAQDCLNATGDVSCRHLDDAINKVENAIIDMDFHVASIYEPDLYMGVVQYLNLESEKKEAK